MHRIYLLLFSLTLSLSASAQTSYSLGDEAAYITRQEQEAAAAPNDSIKANAYLKLSLLYRRVNDAEKSKAAVQQGTDLAKGYPLLEAASYYYRSIVEFVPGDITALEKKLITSDSLLQPFNNPEAYKLRSIIWNNYGILQQMKGDEKGALDAFVNKAVQYAIQSGDLLVLGKSYKAMAIIFMNANQREKAATYMQQSIAALRRAPLENPINLTELIEAYINAGENFVNLPAYDSARNSLDQARRLLTPYPGSNLYMSFYFAEGVYLYKTNRSAQAVISLDKGIDLATKLGAVHSLNRLTYAKYKALSIQKEYKKAVVVLEELVRSPHVFTVDKQLYYQELYSTYAALGNTRDAFRWAKQYITLSDSLHKQQLQKDIAELENKFKHAESERKITLLQAEKERAATESHNNRLLAGLLGTISLFLFVSVVLGVVLYRQRSVRYRQQLKDTEQQQQIQLTRALMQGEEKERKRLAADLHDGLGGQLAGIKINLSRLATGTSHPDTQLQKVIEQLDVSANELRRIARNMMPESLLLMGLEPALKDMCDSLSTDTMSVNFQPFGIQRDIQPEVQINIYRIVQELLTNAVRHAHAREILVQCSQNGTRFFITLEDNGKGFDPAAIIARPGIGLSNARSRVEYLNGKLDITSAPGEGTTINIEFDVTTR
ncbi:sensor histidine kinase [Dawidia soli]|uniref:histidine kinase n=1 Tax=Dawidia soli TaxID=2782352 RepID=A0AAP2D9Z0_9BACT|nr:sensor histidine kinase [Dawidia soli]MBT1687989.1 ATP-binding protein [Dawidia soli]